METRSIRNKGMGLLILGALMVCLFTGLAHAQVVFENTAEDWIYTYNGPYSQLDEAKIVKPNWYTGNILVAGRCWAGIGPRYDIVVISLTPTGDTSWVYTYNGIGNDDDAAEDIISSWYDGYIYVAGMSERSSSNEDLVVIKLDTLGNEKWVYRYNSGYNKNDGALAIEVWNDMHIYVAGYSERATNNKDLVVIKIDTLGNQKRVFRHNGPGNSNDQANVLKIVGAVGAPDIYVGGYHTGSNGKDFLVAKLDTHLTTPQWIDPTDGDAHGDDECRSFNVDWNSTVYAAGYLTNAGTGKDFTVMKYNPAGYPDWTYSYDGPGSADDEAYDVCVDGWDYCIYAAGYSTDTIGGGGMDYTVINIYGWDGSEFYVYRYNGPGNGNDCALSIDMPYSGYDWYFAAGYSTGEGTGTDLTVTKHAQWGVQAPYWLYRYDGGGGVNGGDQAYSISAEMGLNQIWVAGRNRWGTGTNNQDLLAIELPVNFPPTIPELISPADSAWLNDTTVRTRWNKSQNPETGTISYIMQYDTDVLFTSPDSFVQSGTTKVFTVFDSTYYWRVKAKVLARHSDWSEAWSFNFDLTDPLIPTLMSPIGDAFVLDTSVTFDWGDVTFRDFPTLIHYVIQIDTDEAFPAPIVDDTMTVSTANYILAGDDRYYWRIKAYDLASNESPYSDAESFRLDMSPPLIDSTTVWENTPNMGPFSVYTKVTDLFGVDSVILYFKRMEDPVWFPIEMVEGSGNIYFEEIPLAGMANDTIKYYIYAKDNAGRASFDLPGAPTDYYWFIAGYDPGAMEYDTPTVFSFGLKSNPARGKALFSLALPEAANVTLRIYDATGRLMDKVISGRQSAGYYEIPWTSGANAGVYFYSFESPYHNEVGKLILVR